jgi:hypothetical protein
MSHVIEFMDADGHVIAERRREERDGAYAALDTAVADATAGAYGGKVTEVRMREGGRTAGRYAIAQAEKPKRTTKDDGDGIPAAPPEQNLEMPPPAHPELGPNEEQQPEPEPEPAEKPKQGRTSNRAQTVAARDPKDAIGGEPRPAVQTAKSGQGPQSVPLKQAETFTQKPVAKKAGKTAKK